MTCLIKIHSNFVHFDYSYMLFFFFFFFLRAALMACGDSQARGLIRAKLPAYATATPYLSHVCNLSHSSRQHQILHLLSKARNRTCNLMVPNRIC